MDVNKSATKKVQQDIIVSSSNLTPASLMASDIGYIIKIERSTNKLFRQTKIQDKVLYFIRCGWSDAMIEKAIISMGPGDFTEWKQIGHALCYGESGEALRSSTYTEDNKILAKFYSKIENASLEFGVKLADAMLDGMQKGHTALLGFYVQEQSSSGSVPQQDADTIKGTIPYNPSLIVAASPEDEDN